jgi:hypothetical protein
MKLRTKLRKLRDRRNVFSYYLKRPVLLIMIGDFQNGETSPLSVGTRHSKAFFGITTQPPTVKDLVAPFLDIFV